MFAALAMVTGSLLVVANSARSLLPDADAPDVEAQGDAALAEATDAAEGPSRPVPGNS